ncbi:MAG: LTA synthase family protein, partial [Bacteroidetes bacterium]|nr:LTA synthase family protein [Bacteroidota bacterium]
QIKDSLYHQSGRFKQIIHSPAPNVIVIVWESFTKKATHIQINEQEVTPSFNRLKTEGIYFSNIYASGDRTNKGLPAVLSGYPALPDGSIIQVSSKSGKLSSLGNILKERGYDNRFYYGGEPEFANIKSYLLQSGYSHIISINDFSKKDRNSKWGAHDEVVMNRIVSDFSQLKQPFFTTWLTLSSHEPFETTEPQPAFPGTDIKTKFLNSLHYTDGVLGAFVDQCKQQPWWQNTIMIIVADHGHPLPETGHRVDDFKIPLLWLGGALDTTGLVIDKYASQLDIATTLAKQIGVQNNYFPFSKNIFDSTVLPWSFFTFNNGFGFVQPDKKLIFDNIGKQVIEKEGPVTNMDIEAGKALQQLTYQDYIDK